MTVRPGAEGLAGFRRLTTKSLHQITFVALYNTLYEQVDHVRIQRMLSPPVLLHLPGMRRLEINRGNSAHTALTDT